MRMDQHAIPQQMITPNFKYDGSYLEEIAGAEDIDGDSATWWHIVISTLYAAYKLRAYHTVLP